MLYFMEINSWFSVLYIGLVAESFIKKNEENMQNNSVQYQYIGYSFLNCLLLSW